MKFRLFSCAMLFVVSLLFLINQPALAQGKGDSKDSKPAAGAPDMEAMMKEYMKFAQPGPEHQQLMHRAGTWEHTTKMWMDPKQPPIETKGTAEFKMILGGRFLVQEYHSEFMGMPFHGFGVTGYDNFKKQYVGMWTDVMASSMLNTLGTPDASGKTVTFIGQMDDPVMGEKNKQFKMIEKAVDDNKFIDEMYDNIPGVGEVKVMEITYTRKK